MRNLGVTAALVLAVAFGVGAAGARAVIPGPTDVSPAPPPIPALPAAGETPPPTSAISDPIEPRAVCGDWHRESAYGGTWPAQSTWWEFECRYQEPQCTGQCNADWGPCVWLDHFYWDGARAVFYGEFFGDFYFDSMYSASGCSYWWDEPTSRWYLIDCPPEEPANDPPVASIASACSDLTCVFDGGTSSDSDGLIVSYEWVFGDGEAASGASIQHTYDGPATYTVTLTVTDDRGSWSRDTETIVLSVPNVVPTAAFTVSCSEVRCTFDGASSRDDDGTIVDYGWTFGDGSTAAGTAVTHVYAQPGSYTVMLTVVDNGDAVSTSTQTVALISLSARGYKLHGVQKADLSWTGVGGMGFDVYRNGSRIATAQATTYSDTLGKRSAGTYSYRVCAVATSVCSNDATVTF